MSEESPKRRGAFWYAILFILLVPLPWYVCFLGCKWTLVSLITSFAWFRLIFLSPWFTSLSFVLPIVYGIIAYQGIKYVMNNPSRRNLLLAGAVIGGLLLLSTILE